MLLASEDVGRWPDHMQEQGYLEGVKMIYRYQAATSTDLRSILPNRFFRYLIELEDHVLFASFGIR